LSDGDVTKVAIFKNKIEKEKESMKEKAKD